MKRIRISKVALACALALASLHAGAQGRVDAVGLGTLSGGLSVGQAINATGDVTGYSYVNTNDYHAFLYSGGSMQDLGTLGGHLSQGFGISPNGAVTGSADLANGDSHAFVYSAGSMRDLGTLGGNGSAGTGVNASGQVVGWSYIAGNNTLHGFLYSQSGGMRDLGTLGGNFSEASGINANGVVTGYATTLNSAFHAFIYSGGVMQDIGTLAGNLSQGVAINASGQVAGYSTYTTANSNEHAILYSNGTMADLGTLGGSQSIGLAINATGQVAGWSYTPADAALHAFVYAGGKMVDLNSLGIPGWNFYEAIGINDNLQITGYGDNGFSTQAFVVTLQPDWQGGNGSWSDANHWNFAGLGAMGVTPGAVHDVVINPTGSATVYGTDATVRSLLVAGNTGQIVTLNLNGGAIETSNGTTIDPNGVLAGSGRLGGTLTVNAGGRINVGGGESMQLAGGAVYNAGTVRVLGTAASPASLEVGGALTNSSGGQINAQNANLSFLGGLSNAGQVNVTFGVSNIAGSINNASGGKIIVSNGAQASFFDSVVNNGELRVSAGGAANFFGLVSGAGSFTGTGQSRFEGGFSPGNSPALVTVDTTSTFSSSSPITMELGGTTPGSGHDKVVFNGAVSLEGGDLDVLWYGGWTGSAGDVYDLFDWNGGLSGLFGNVNLPTLASGLSWDIANLYTSGEISVLGPVPEPETYAMLLAGLGLLGFAGRRRKNGRISTN